ncbi:hypothetical protein QWZ08_19700 [Ferruginibacter paludis]|uniref:hypothetical protein n=1 Tax=Ferruginibacter paludis TaxID=1310417 RepID=UPI0025B2A420|nr:hypothetical protein [Ferruginibacter paludis]MDN3657887.1 hypothetical protein [Ferruginibacter paludis]
MKKLVIILTAIVAFNVATAQQRNNSNYNDPYEMNNPRNNDHYGSQENSTDYAYNENSRRNDNHDRDRITRQYDRRDNDYRNDRSTPGYGKSRRMGRWERDRPQQRGASFGTGVTIGAVAGVLLGVLISH